MTRQAQYRSTENPQPNGNKRSFLAGCFIFLFLTAFILVGAAAMHAVNAEFFLFRKGVYLQVFEENGLYERFPGLISEPLAGQAQTGVEGGQLSAYLPNRGVLQYLDREDYRAILSSLITPDWVREQASGLLDQVLAYVNLETPGLRAVISMVEIRERLQGETGQDILERIMSSWPACTMSQLLEMASAGLNGNLENSPVCLPPEEYIPMITPALQDGLHEMAADIPDEVDLIQQSGAGSSGAASEPGMQGVDPLRGESGQVYDILRWSIRLAPLVALGLLALLTLAAVRSWRDIALWWGLALAGAGVLALATSLTVGLPLADRLLERAVGDELTGSMPGLAQLVLETGRTVFERYFFWVGVEAAILALAGFVLLLIALLVSRRG